MRLTRDSWVLVIGIFAGIVLYLTGAKPIGEWGYYEYLAALGYAISVISAQLGTSPLPGAPKTDRIDLKKLGTWLVLAAVVSGLAVAGCGPKTKPVLVKADMALYQSVKAISDTEVVLARAGVLTPAQSLKINEALLPAARLGLEATQALRAWQPGQPLPPQLGRLTKELGDVTRIIIDLVAHEPAKAQLLEKVALAQQAVLVIITLSGVV